MLSWMQNALIFLTTLMAFLRSHVHGFNMPIPTMSLARIGAATMMTFSFPTEADTVSSLNTDEALNDEQTSFSGGAIPHKNLSLNNLSQNTTCFCIAHIETNNFTPKSCLKESTSLNGILLALKRHQELEADEDDANEVETERMEDQKSLGVQKEKIDKWKTLLLTTDLCWVRRSEQVRLRRSTELQT